MARMSEWRCPDWLLDALKVLKPAGKLTVTQWADTKRVLPATSSMPGRWRTGFTPYLAGIMDTFSDPEVEEISVVKSTQVGGTELILNMMGFAIEQDPSPMMVVYPTESLGEYISENRIQQMVRLCPSLRERFDQNSRRLELQFVGMYIIISGANSPSSLASYPIRYLFMDEIDKYPPTAGKEADPRALARERTRTYDNDKKIVNISTPTYEAGPIWQEWTNADTQYEYFVTCPHCGESFTFQFKCLRFESDSPEQAQQTAVYVCEHCGGLIRDNHRQEMVREGRWQAVKENGRRRVAFRITAFLSPWLRLGDIAYEWVSSRNDPGRRMNFINSWLAEPYKDVKSTTSAEWLLENRQSQYEEDEIPPETVMLTGGVDVQRDCFYWVIRAWAANMTSRKVAHGKVFAWREIEFEMNRTRYDREKNGYTVNLCCVDSGDQTDDVYNFCLINSEWAVPVKGSTGKINGRYSCSVIDKVGSRANGHPLYILDVGFYKDMIFSRLRRDEDEGGWYINKGTDIEYCEMLTAEHKVMRKLKNGRTIQMWEPKATGRDNHYLDCEVYAALAADLLGIREVNAQGVNREREVLEQPVAPALPAPAQPREDSGFFGRETGKGWFGGWK